MELRKDGWYKADVGKHFVLTEKGKAEVASYKSKTVGEPISDYDTEAVKWSVDNGYEKEVPIEDWITKTGYEVIYDYKGHLLHAGNPIVFPEKELAEKYMVNCKNNPRVKYGELYIKEAVFEGRALKDCREYKGKKVYNKDWYYGISVLFVKDLLEDEVINALINEMEPKSLTYNYFQMATPMSEEKDEKGRYRNVYATFKRIDKDIWEYCGECFYNEAQQPIACAS